jgi:hypothetical protein
VVGVEDERALVRAFLADTEVVGDGGAVVRAADPLVTGAELESGCLGCLLDRVEGGEEGGGVDAVPALSLIVRVTDSPSVWKVTCLMAGAPLSRTVSSSPQRRSWTTPVRAIECVEMVSLGKDAWSTTTTSRPRRASTRAVAAPATRLPTITTS